jgi:RNA polymerase-binding transcription factor DksA
MADDADRAQTDIDLTVRLGLAKFVKLPASGATECCDCGDPIPAERQRLAPESFFCTSCSRSNPTP